MEQTIIIGAGQAGHCAAFEMRRQKYGGRILLVGDEPLQPYERPPLSKEVLLQASQPEPKVFSPADRYRSHDIELFLSAKVQSLDRSGFVSLSNGERLGYDRLLLAAGGRARVLDIPGSEHIAYMRTWADALAIRARLGSARDVLCIGGGVIGLEVAASARRADCSVVVVEASPAIMNRCLAAPQAAMLQQKHRDAGVDIRLQQSLASIERADDRLVTTFRDGEQSAFDLIVAGIGMVRSVELAAQAGLETDNGIFVDQYACTSDPRIFAAGDATAFMHDLYPNRMRLESWYHAQNHGACAGRAMAGAARAYDDIPRFWTDQYDLNIQVAGFPADAVLHNVIGDEEAAAFTVLHADHAGRLIGLTAVNQPRSLRPGIEAIRKRLPGSPDLLHPAPVRAARRA